MPHESKEKSATDFPLHPVVDESPAEFCVKIYMAVLRAPLYPVTALPLRRVRGRRPEQSGN